MAGRVNRRKVAVFGSVCALAILALPAGAPAQEPDEPGPEEQIEDPQLRGLHARMLGLHDQMQELRAEMAARRQELLGEEEAQTPPHEGRHMMHLRGLGEARDTGMGMQGMRGRGMMMGRQGMGRGMTNRDAASESEPRWWPNGMRRRMGRGMTGQDPEGGGGG